MPLGWPGSDKFSVGATLRKALMPELARNGADGAIDPGLNPGAKTRDNPWDPVEINSASVFGNRVAEPILASGHVRPRKQAGHMIASDPIKTLYLNLQAGGRPHMDPGSHFARPGRQYSLIEPARAGADRG